MKKDGIDAEFSVARRAKDFLGTIALQKPDLILLDNGVPGSSGDAALDAVRNLIPEVPVIVVSGSADDNRIRDCLQSGARDYVLKDHLWKLPATIRRAVSGAEDQNGACL